MKGPAAVPLSVAPAVVDLAAALAGATDESNLARRLCAALVDAAGARVVVVRLAGAVATTGTDDETLPAFVSDLARSPEVVPALVVDGVARVGDDVVLAEIPDAGLVYVVGVDADERLVASFASLAGRLLARMGASAVVGEDRATGLLNEHGIVELLADGGTTVVVAGMEDMAEVTGAFGPTAAAALTRLLAARLSALDGVEGVGLLGGGRLAVVVTGDVDVVESVVAAASEPVALGRFEVAVIRYAGIAAGTVAPRQLLERAEVARREAAATGVAWVAHTPALADAVFHRLAVAAELRRALAGGDLVALYQPQVDRTGRVVAVEALVRWMKADGTCVPPADFLPVAERAGLLPDIDLHVLALGCAQLRVWAQEGVDVRLAVNLSAATLARPGIDRAILDVLVRAGVDPGLLEVEITESLAADEGGWVEVLAALRRCGVTVAIDDFGTGYSSLARIHRLPIDRLKIDRSFVADMAGVGGGVSAAVIAMARALGLRVLAEGVEDASQKARLDALGCDEYQGYWFGRPMPAASISSVVRAG